MQQDNTYNYSILSTNAYLYSYLVLKTVNTSFQTYGTLKQKYDFKWAGNTVSNVNKQVNSLSKINFFKSF